MISHDPVFFRELLFRELPLIKKIIADETWLEAERRGSPVLPSDPAVRARVCEIVLRIGQQLRDSVQPDVAATAVAGLEPTAACHRDAA